MAHDIESNEAITSKSSTRRNPLSLVPAWAYAFAVIATLGIYTWSRALAVGGGTIGYALDDAYIHMAIAKNFAFHGVWGVSPFQAVSSSSSPGWVLLLTFFFKVMGNHDWIPLALNIAAALGLAYVVDRLLRPYAPSLIARTSLLTAVLLIVPLPYFISMGMEHTLQILLVAVYFAFARKIAAPDDRLTNRDHLMLILLCGAMVLIRVEDAVLFPVPFLYALLKKQWRTAGSIVLGPILALVLFALIAHSQGFGIEPTSMMVKRSHIQIPDIIVINRQEVAYGHHSVWQWLALKFWFDLSDVKEIAFYFFALVAMLIVLISKPRGNGSAILLASTAVFGFVLHAANGDFGWHSRYEGYLVVFSVLAMIPTCIAAAQTLVSIRSYALPSRMWAAATLALAVFAIACLAVRSAFDFQTNSRLMADIGWQQVQVGRFLSQFYSGKSVLLNDIGAPSYLTDLHLTDIYGLATPEVAQAKVDYKMNAEFLKGLILKNHVEIAIVYPVALPKILPPDNVPYPLIPVAKWTLPEDAQIGRTVMFLAGNPDEVPVLFAKLQQYQPQLPSGVVAQYAAQ